MSGQLRAAPLPAWGGQTLADQQGADAVRDGGGDGRPAPRRLAETAPSVHPVRLATSTAGSVRTSASSASVQGRPAFGGRVPRRLWASPIFACASRGVWRLPPAPPRRVRVLRLPLGLAARWPTLLVLLVRQALQGFLGFLRDPPAWRLLDESLEQFLRPRGSGLFDQMHDAHIALLLRGQRYVLAQ